MSDLERLLRTSLEDVGNRYEPSDETAARERFLQRKRGRRFRFAISGVAVAAAAVAAALLVFSVPATEDETPLPSVAAPQPVATIGVGQQPVSATVGGQGVWVAEKDASSLSLIDPTTDQVEETISVRPDPDEVAADGRGTVWVAYEDGSVTRVYTGAVGTLDLEETFPLTEGDEVHLDLAATPDGLIAVDPATGQIFEVSNDPGESAVRGSSEGSPRLAGGFAATDVAYGEDGVWFLDGIEGELLPYPTLSSGEPLARRLSNAESNLPRMQVEGGDNADLAVGGGGVWIATGTGGSLYRIDLASGDISVEIEVGGRYTDLAIEDDVLWALTGGDGPSMLRQFDARTGRMAGEALEMSGRPTDVAAAGGSAWVTDGDGANVVRVDPGSASGENPVEEENGTGLVAPDDVVFAYSELGDIYVQTRSGEPIRLTDTPRKSEVNPAISPEGDALIYEVMPGSLERLDLASGESRDLGEGSTPSFGPDGTLAWVVNNAADGTEIHVGPAGEEPTRRVSAEDCSAEAGGPPDPAQMCPMVVRNLSWAPDGSALYYEAGWEFGFALYQLQMDEGSQPFDLGEATGYEIGGDLLSYAAPTNVANDSVYVVRSCCTKGPDQEPTSHEFGLIRFTEGGPEYEDLFDLGALDATSTDWQAAPLGTWTLGEDGTWEESDERTWLISDSAVLWLVDESGDATEVRDPGPGSGGILSSFQGLTARR